MADPTVDGLLDQLGIARMELAIERAAHDQTKMRLRDAENVIREYVAAAGEVSMATARTYGVSVLVCVALTSMVATGLVAVGVWAVLTRAGLL